MLDVSFVLGGLLGYLRRDGFGWRIYVPGWNLRADFQ
jgi:hypothetical protein